MPELGKNPCLFQSKKEFKILMGNQVYHLGKVEFKRWFTCFWIFFHRRKDFSYAPSAQTWKEWPVKIHCNAPFAPQPFRDRSSSVLTLRLFISLIFKSDSTEVGVEGNLKGSGTVLTPTSASLAAEAPPTNSFPAFKNCWRIKVSGIWYHGSSWWQQCWG